MRTLFSFIAGFFATLIFHQLALADLAASLDIRGPRLQPRHVDLLELQLGRVLDRSPLRPVLHGSHSPIWRASCDFAGVLGRRLGYRIWANR